MLKAEYLTEYVPDGWDCTIDAKSKEVGAIAWGPNYVIPFNVSYGCIGQPHKKKVACNSNLLTLFPQCVLQAEHVHILFYSRAVNNLYRVQCIEFFL